MKLNKRIGQGVTEYSLIFGLVLLVVITTLPLLQSSLSHSVEGMIPQRKEVLKTSVSTASTATIAAINTEDLGAKPALEQMPLVLSTDGTDISSVISAVQTVGANGATSMLADSLLSLAKQLKAEGSIDESTYNDIVKLANQGHSIAQIEAALETSIKAAGTEGGGVYGSAGIQFSDSTYSGPQLAAKISGTSPDIQTFQVLQNKVLNSSQINNPNAKVLIAELSDNILNVANAATTYGTILKNINRGDDAYSRYLNGAPLMIEDYASRTKENSNSICATQSNGNACTK